MPCIPDREIPFSGEAEKGCVRHMLSWLTNLVLR